MNEMDNPNKSLKNISFTPESFFQTFILELAGLLQDVYGVEETSRLMKVTTQNVTPRIIKMYKETFDTVQCTQHQLLEMFAGFMNRIHGDFYIEDNAVPVIANRRCPFGEQAAGKTSLCMMTTEIANGFLIQMDENVTIELKQSIAMGQPECKLHIYPSN